MRYLFTLDVISIGMVKEGFMKMPVMSIGAIIADDLKKNYLPTAYSLKQLKKEQLVPEALIFAAIKKGKSGDLQLIQFDISRRVDAVKDVPLGTPRFELDDVMFARHRFRQYQQWFIDDGRNIRPLMKTTFNDLEDNLLITNTTDVGTVVHAVTHV